MPSPYSYPYYNPRAENSLGSDSEMLGESAGGLGSNEMLGENGGSLGSNEMLGRNGGGLGGREILNGREMSGGRVVFSAERVGLENHSRQRSESESCIESYPIELLSVSRGVVTGVRNHTSQ